MSAENPQRRFPLDDSPFGMGIYPSVRTSGGETIRAAELARDAGIRWTRDEISWGRLQPTRGEWRWDQFDHAIDTMRAHGVATLGLLAYAAPWATTARTPDGKPDVVSLPDLAAWKEYVGAVVERYRDRVHAWQMWNEPNGTGFWHPKPDAKEYARLFLAGAQAAKAADPTCWIAGSAISMMDLAYIRALFDEGGWEKTDIITIHPYRYPHTPEGADLLGELLHLAELSADYGGVKPIWMTEFGYPAFTGPGGCTDWWSAVMLMRTYLVSWASGIVGKVFWYDFRDDGDDPGYSEARFGIIRRDWTPKMAYEAFRTMTTSLDGFQPVGRIDLGSDVYLLRFQRLDREQRYVVWAIRQNVRRPVPVPASRVKLVKPWAEPRTVEAPGGWLMLHIDATPTFLVPA